jgi:hypothetical protein
MGQHTMAFADQTKGFLEKVTNTFVIAAAGDEPTRYLRHALEANLLHVTNYVKEVCMVACALQSCEEADANSSERTSIRMHSRI